MHIVIADKSKTEVQELRKFFNGTGDRNICISEYTSIGQFIENYGYSGADADIYYISITQSNDSAIKVAAKIKEEKPFSQIIFIVSELKFVEECYEVEHVYCLARPFTEQSIIRSYEKAKCALHENEKTVFSFSVNGNVYMVKFTDIMFFEKDMRKVKVHFADGSIKEFYEKMESLLKKIPKEFKRCHNSYVVNMHYVKEYNSKQCILKSGETIPISRAYKLSI